MDKKETAFQEQEAPLKNTDNAFVQVSKDGSPSIPEQEENKEIKPDKKTDLDRR